MIVTCTTCTKRFDDEYRTTICPHETFAANDGQNNFAHHPESFIDSFGYCQLCGRPVEECMCEAPAAEKQGSD